MGAEAQTAVGIEEETSEEVTEEDSVVVPSVVALVGTAVPEGLVATAHTFQTCRTALRCSRTHILSTGVPASRRSTARS